MKIYAIEKQVWSVWVNKGLGGLRVLGGGFEFLSHLEWDMRCYPPEIVVPKSYSHIGIIFAFPDYSENVEFMIPEISDD